MQYAVHFHHEHQVWNDNHSDGFFAGPFTLDEAKAELQRTIDAQDDPLFKLYPDNERYAGYDWEELEKANRNGDIASEVSAEIIELHPTINEAIANARKRVR
jgi:hypothetical protein